MSGNPNNIVNDGAGMSPDAAADAALSDPDFGASLFGDDAGAGDPTPAQTRSGKPLVQDDDGEQEDQSDEQEDDLQNSDIDDAEKGDDDPQGDGDEDDGEGKAKAADEDEDGEADEDLYELDFDGETKKVPVSELVEAYQAKQKGELDYQAKVGALRQEAQTVVSQHVQAINAQRQQLIQQLQAQMQAMGGDPKLPDRALLDPRDPKYNPDEYYGALADYQEAVQSRESLKNQLQEQQQTSQREQQFVLEAIKRTQTEQLLQKWPDWQKQEVRQDLLNGVTEHYGFQPQEVAGIYDHRFYELARDAVAFRRQKAAPAKPVKPSAKPAPKAADTTPGRKARPTDGKAKGRQDALKRIRGTRNLGDIARAFEDHLPDDII